MASYMYNTSYSVFTRQLATYESDMYYLSGKTHERRQKDKEGMKSDRAESVFTSAAQKWGSNEATPEIHIRG